MGMQTATWCKLDLVWPPWAFQTHLEYPLPLQVALQSKILLRAASMHTAQAQRACQGSQVLSCAAAQLIDVPISTWAVCR